MFFTTAFKIAKNQAAKSHTDTEFYYMGRTPRSHVFEHLWKYSVYNTFGHSFLDDFSVGHQRV